MPTYVYECGSCDIEWDELRPIDNRDDPCHCTECGSAALRMMTAPAILRASYHMGYRRGSAYEEGKRIAALKVKRAGIRESDRGAVNQEINDRNRVGKRKRDKTE